MLILSTAAREFRATRHALGRTPDAFDGLRPRRSQSGAVSMLTYERPLGV